MKELQIIIKSPDDGDPLNMGQGYRPLEGTLSVGYKLRPDDGGEWYGDYLLLDDAPMENLGYMIRECIGLMLDEALETEGRLLEGRQTKHEHSMP